MRGPLTDFQLIRYIDSTTHELMAECGACRIETALDVMEIIDGYGANLWIGELRERLECRQCGARAARIFIRGRPMVQF